MTDIQHNVALTADIGAEESRALALVREGLARIDVLTANVHDWRRLRELLACVREAQRFRHERVRSRIRARVDAERRRLLPAQARNAELRVEMLELAREEVELEVERQRVEQERQEATMARLRGLVPKQDD